jgi:hypothetical protein
MHITPNNKLASLGTVGLLFLAGIAGMVFLLPASPVHAATPTVTLSTISSGVLTATSSATVGSSLVITGSGFLGAKPIAISSTVGTLVATWLTAGSCTTTYGGTSGTDSLVVSGCLTTTAAGTFQVKVSVPNLPGGANTITVSDGTNTVNAALTVTSAVSVAYAGSNFGFPGESIAPTITVTGFGSGESVSIATSMWSTATFSCTTGATVGTFGTCTAGGGVTVAQTTGGAKSITATGATSALTASATYTVNPWAAFYLSQSGATIFSFLGTAPTSLLVEAHGLAAGTIAANSITIGGVATNHASVTVGSSGAFGGASTFLVVSPTSNVPFGPVSVVIGGVTFSYGAGNIAYSAGTWGGALISSIGGIPASSTGVVTTDASEPSTRAEPDRVLRVWIRAGRKRWSNSGDSHASGRELDASHRSSSDFCDRRVLRDGHARRHALVLSGNSSITSDLHSHSDTDGRPSEHTEPNVRYHPMAAERNINDR